MPAKKTQAPPKNFEEGLEELEQIIAEIEEGKIGLEESLQRQERAQFLLQYARAVLDKAEQQIQLLSAAGDGSLHAAPLEAPRAVSPAEPAPSAADLLHAHAQKLTVYLEEFLARHAGAPPRLAEAIAYSLLAGGKRLRPALVMECCSACGGRADSRSALSAAAAVELVHTFSLVHDDLPAMDDDDLRRGRPTNHKVFGEAMAILAGDAMVALAFEAIAADASPSVAPALARTLAVATGPMGMIGGQVLDMEGENRALSRPELEHLHRLKTGALLTASCRMGAIAAGAPNAALAAVSEYGRHLGLAFQIVDDVLDVTASAQQMGKATGKDAARGKNTYPALLGLEQSRAAAQERLAAALAALAPLGKSAAGLEQLAKFVVQRER